MIRVCPSCQSKNRIPPERLTDSSRCGACKTALPPVSEPLDVDEREFDSIVRGSKWPVLVDFWAPWCGPCRMAKPEVAKAATQLSGRAVVLQVNTDQHPELSGRFGVRGIPHFVVLKEGKVIASRSGLARADELVRLAP